MSKGMHATAIVAEDEAPQRAELLDLLAGAWPQLEVLAACEDGIGAMQALAEHRPQVALLDIRMPGVSGLDVARAAVAGGAHVVITTAYDEYAIRAFDAGAIDYLLKPLQATRLAQAVARLQARLHAGTPASATAIDALEARLRPAGERAIRWISASAGDSVRMIGIEEVLYFRARDKYVCVVTAEGEAVIRMPIRDLLAGLDPDEFWQVHRGIVVRVSAIDRMHRDELGKHGLRLRGRDEWLPVSAAFLHRFRGM
jgi:DNA-binding LytR/AlgR family response regulator